MVWVLVMVLMEEAGPASVFDLLSKADKERLMAIKQQTILKQLPQPSKGIIHNSDGDGKKFDGQV